MSSYLVATVKPWNIMAFFYHTVKLPGTWALTSNPDFLLASIKEAKPRYVFFPHWPWKVPSEITDNYECVCFHMTDLPYGRGGSPLQNLILRQHKDTMLTALRMTDELDAGPIYMKKPLSLEGRAEEIYSRAADLMYEMVESIIRDNPLPVPQQGEVTSFKRRTPERSRLPSRDMDFLYDHIRMLDAPTYPLAYLEWGEFRIQFHHARKVNGMIEAQVIIGKKS